MLRDNGLQAERRGSDSSIVASDHQKQRRTSDIDDCRAKRIFLLPSQQLLILENSATGKTQSEADSQGTLSHALSSYTRPKTGEWPRWSEFKAEAKQSKVHA